MFKFRNSNHLPEVAVTVTTETYVRLAALTIAILIVFFAIKKAEHALVLVFVSFFLAVALNAPVYWLSRKLPGKKNRRALATTLSFLFVVILLGIFIASIVPPLVRQTDNLIKATPHLVQEFRSQDSPVGKFIRHY